MLDNYKVLISHCTLIISVPKLFIGLHMLSVSCTFITNEIQNVSNEKTSDQKADKSMNKRICVRRAITQLCGYFHFHSPGGALIKRIQFRVTHYVILTIICMRFMN